MEGSSFSIKEAPRGIRKRDADRPTPHLPAVPRCPCVVDRHQRRPRVFSWNRAIGRPDRGCPREFPCRPRVPCPRRPGLIPRPRRSRRRPHAGPGSSGPVFLVRRFVPAPCARPFHALVTARGIGTGPAGSGAPSRAPRLTRTRSPGASPARYRASGPRPVGRPVPQTGRGG